MEIRKLAKKEYDTALQLAWNVFCKFEAIDYPEEGKQAFYRAIHSAEYLAMLDVYGAFNGEKMVGVLATRSLGSHIALFFVDGEYHKRGIGRQLWEKMLAETTSNYITVHSSLYAVEVYHKLGFVQTGDVEEEDGISYVPMEYDVLKKARTTLVCALAQPWVRRERIYLDELEAASSLIHMSELDRIRVMHYSNDYSFLDGYMIWKECDVEKLANLLTVILDISEAQYAIAKASKDFTELRENIKSKLTDFSDEEADGIIQILTFEMQDENRLCGKIERNLEDGVVVKVSKSDEGRICKDYYACRKLIKRIKKTGTSMAEGFFYNEDNQLMEHKTIYLSLK